MKKLISLFLVLVLMLSLSVTAFASSQQGDDPVPGDAAESEAAALEDAFMTKDLTVADGIDIDDVKTFTFSFTAVGTDTAAAEDHPAIADQTIDVTAEDGGHAYGKKALSEVFVIGNFTHAGEYVWTVAETTTAFETTEGDITKTLTVDATEYEVHVYVTNGTDGLEFSGVIVKKGDEKVDPTMEESDKTSGFNFNNQYKEVIEHTTEDGVLAVNKTITGDYADKTKEFPITVEITIPALDTAEEVALADTELTITWNEKVGTVTANLADGGKIEFTKLPAGTTYVVKETQDALYKSKVTGDVETADTAYVEGNVEKAGSGPVVAAGNVVNIENNREDVVPTGLIIRTMPYVILVLAAIAGLAYLVIKKRAYND